MEKVAQGKDGPPSASWRSGEKLMRYRSVAIFTAIALLGLASAKPVLSDKLSPIESTVLSTSPMEYEVQEETSYSFADTHNLRPAWDQGLTGEGSLIVVIDDGRAEEHNVNLAGEACISKEDKENGFYSDCPNGEEIDTSVGASIDRSSDYDAHGHYMMHIAASRGRAGEGQGAAPGAEVFPIKISTRLANGEKVLLLDSLEQAILFTPSLKERFPGRQILMSVSLEMLSNSDHCDSQFTSMYEAIKKARSEEIPFIGSSRPNTFPGCLSNVERTAPTDLHGEALLQYNPLSTTLAAVGDGVCVYTGTNSVEGCFRGASVSTSLTTGLFGVIASASGLSDPDLLSERVYDYSSRVNDTSAYLINVGSSATDGAISPQPSSDVKTAYLPTLLKR